MHIGLPITSVCHIFPLSLRKSMSALLQSVQRWWTENYDRIMELHNVERLNRQAFPFLTTRGLKLRAPSHHLLAENVCREICNVLLVRVRGIHPQIL
ncbi:hypothetical protein MLD38_006542 [Melastoma candidum]|uniref:Uncharacterized protein n=1 Tax=Melastoma candidum TaxID=119954 RepID=A0ACB9RMF9_9MYRT|nr:hypothetical protein MLD38_006542 [Melastoma candidum]